MRYVIIILLSFTTLFCAPAYNAPRVFKQADGTEFTARPNGNHHLNWIEDQNGEILKYNAKNGNFEYAIIDKNDLKASGVRYKKNTAKKSISKEKRKIKKIEKKQLKELMKKRKGVRFK